jgi:hypothetical protein
MSGFKTREPIAALPPAIAAVRVNQGKSNPQLPAPEGGTSGKPKAGKGPIHRRSPSQKFGGRQTKTPFPDGRSRKERFVDFFNADAATKPNTMLWPKFKHHDPKKTKKASSLKYQCLGNVGPDAIWPI